MIVVMAASGSAETVRSPKQVWCFSEADARRAANALAAQYESQDAVDVFSVDFPEVNEAALAERIVAEDGGRLHADGAGDVPEAPAGVARTQ